MKKQTANRAEKKSKVETATAPEAPATEAPKARVPRRCAKLRAKAEAEGIAVSPELLSDLQRRAKAA